MTLCCRSYETDAPGAMLFDGFLFIGISWFDHKDFYVSLTADRPSSCSGHRTPTPTKRAQHGIHFCCAVSYVVLCLAGWHKLDCTKGLDRLPGPADEHGCEAAGSSRSACDQPPIITREAPVGLPAALLGQTGPRIRWRASSKGGADDPVSRL